MNANLHVPLRHPNHPPVRRPFGVDHATANHPGDRSADANLHAPLRHPNHLCVRRSFEAEIAIAEVLA